MARARNIKPSFFKNEYLSELNPLTRLLFIGLWCIADREGRLEDRPKRIKAEILPYDDCDIEELLNELANAEEPFIIRYEVDGERYIFIKNFKKHQNPHKKEAASVIPAPPCLDASTNLSEKFPGNSGTSTGNSETSRADSLKLIPDSPIPHPSSQEEVDDDWVKISDVYTDLTGRMETPLDVQDMKEVLKLADTKQIIQIMREVHKRYKPKYDGDKIKSFSYFRAAIEGELKGGGVGGQTAKHHRKTPKTKYDDLDLSKFEYQG